MTLGEVCCQLREKGECTDSDCVMNYKKQEVYCKILNCKTLNNAVKQIKK